MTVKQTTTIYWSSLTSSPCTPENWVFKDPELVYKRFVDNNISNDRNSIFSCPASAAYFNNLFVFKSNINDYCKWPEGYLKNIADKNIISTLPKFGNNIDLMTTRESAIKGYIDITYNATFVMFADKPLKIRISTPNYPPSTPSEGAMFTSGEFDIGRWFRPATLNWFIPINNTEFKIMENDQLFYFQALTNEKIIFKKFISNNKIEEMSQYFLGSLDRDGRNLPLEKRYEIAEKHTIQFNILNEIKKNLVN